MSTSDSKAHGSTATDDVRFTNQDTIIGEVIATNGDWEQAGYPAGMLMEGSMFPPTARDPRYWGPQDPLDYIGPAGPFDAEDGEESWRVHNHGRHIFTNEARVLSRRPNAQQQERQTKLWQGCGAPRAQAAQAGLQEQADSEGDEPFPDDLPVPSGLATRATSSSRSTAQQSAPAVSGLLQAPPSGSRATTGQPSSDIDGEYELDDEYLLDAPQAQMATADDYENVPDSTPPKISSPRGINDWDDDNLLSFWKFKVIRKKGYEPMLAHFPGQSVESLHEVWKTNRERCEMLSAAWRAAKKPTAPVAEWLDV